MRIPTIRGTIDRRLLVNFHVDPDALSRILPPPFRPKLVRGYGMAGICLIRLKRIRPWFVPWPAGLSSENAAHRIAVEWEDGGQLREGVYIPRRDTSSRWNALAGGRLFPGVHHHARFHVDERDGSYRVRLESDDGRTRVAVAGHVASELPSSSIFGSVREASEFFECGCLGYSATPRPGEFDGLELRTLTWTVQPLDVERVESSVFEDHNLFSPGTVGFDCALLMQHVEHEWHSRPRLRVEPQSGPNRQDSPAACSER